MIEYNLQLLHRFVALKDYYSILNIPVTATPNEIKQAYRKLVMIYHPDKNNNEPYALQKFNEIKEAYEVLTNPRKKELYLQERWLSKASGKMKVDGLITPPNILLKSLELNKQMAFMDIYRMDHQNIADRITQLINEDVIERLHQCNEPDINETIIDCLLAAAKPISYQFSKTITQRLIQLAGSNRTKIQQIQAALDQKKKTERAAKCKLLFIFLLVLLICLLIFLTGK